MVTKTPQNNKPITEADLNTHMDSAFETMGRSRTNAATAIGHLWQIFIHTLSGDGAIWLKNRIDSYNNFAETENQQQDIRFEEADSFMSGGLAADHDAVRKTSTQKEKQEQEALCEKLRADAAISKEQRRKLRYVTLKDRENSNAFVDIVRIGLHLYHHDQSSLVSRNCHAMEFLKSRFGENTEPEIEDIVAAFEQVGGFDSAIEQQRAVKQSGDLAAEIRAISKASIRAAAREKVRILPAVNRFEMPITRTKDGYASVLVRVDGAFVEVLAEADAPDVEIEAAVNRVGNMQRVDAESNCEVAGRVMEFARLVPFGQVIMGDDGKTRLGTSQQFIVMRPGDDGTPEIVVSSSWIEAGPVLVARPHDQTLMGVPDEYVAVRAEDRKKFEAAFRDPGERSIRSISVDLDPKTADGRPSTALMRWDCENLAIKAANPRRLKEKLTPLPEVDRIHWDELNHVVKKPLDIDGFKPQLVGTLTASDISEILALFPKPGALTKAAKEDTEKGKGKAAKIPRVVQFTFASDQLTVVYGDASPVVLTCKTGSKNTINVLLRMQDVMALLSSLRSHDCHTVQLEPDDRGLVKFSWQDAFASYAIHLPTCAADAKLSSKRLGAMRPELPAMAQAAE